MNKNLAKNLARVAKEAYELEKAARLAWLQSEQELRYVDALEAELEAFAEKKIARFVPSRRINYMEGFAMLFVALVVDGGEALVGLGFTGTGVLLGAGIVLNLFIDIVAYGLFWMWFLIRGIHLDQSIARRILGGSFVALIVEIVPILGWLPGWTGFILFLIIQSRLFSIISDKLRKHRTQHQTIT